MSKIDLAVEIYKDELTKGEDGLRKRAIARIKDELGMSDAGASTYFQTAKKKAGGEPIKHYYKPKTETTVDTSPEKPDDDRPLWSRVDTDNNLAVAVDCYLSLEDAEAAREKKGGYVVDREVNIGEEISL